MKSTQTQMVWMMLKKEQRQRLMGTDAVVVIYSADGRKIKSY